MRTSGIFASDQPNSITIYPKDVQQCLDEYTRLKSKFSKTSPYIIAMTPFCDNAQQANPLSHAELKSLAIILCNMQNNFGDSPKAFKASSVLREKMGVLLPYANENLSVFSRFVSNPKLHDDVLTIRNKLPTTDPFSVLEWHSRALAENKDATPCLSIYCDNLRNNQILVAQATRRLEEADRIIYHNIQNVITQHTERSNQEVRDRFGFYDYKRTYYETVTPNNLSKNKIYNAKLDSQENKNFIFKYPKHANVIADVLIKLHEGMIGEFYQSQAERYIRQLTPDVFFALAKAIESADFLKQLKRTLTAKEFQEIIQPFVVAPSMAQSVYEAVTSAMKLK